MEKYSRFFPNYPYTNKYETLNYRFTVESYDDKTKEAVITIEKIKDGVVGLELDVNVLKRKD